MQMAARLGLYQQALCSFYKTSSLLALVCLTILMLDLNIQS